MFSFQRITFVGFGLLASSLAAAIKQAKSKVIIRAVSSPKTLERANRRRDFWLRGNGKLGGRLRCDSALHAHFGHPFVLEKAFADEAF